jgi:hypothetical protein
MSIDDATIRELLALRDEHGVLSFYAGHVPAQAADRQPTAPIELRNQVKALRARLEGADRDLVRAIEDDWRRWTDRWMRWSTQATRAGPGPVRRGRLGRAAHRHPAAPVP